MSTNDTTTTSTPDISAIEEHILDGYDAADMIAELVFDELTARGSDPETIAQELFKFGFQTGLIVGHETGHMCAELEPSDGESEHLPGYL